MPAPFAVGADVAVRDRGDTLAAQFRESLVLVVERLSRRTSLPGERVGSRSFHLVPPVAPGVDSTFALTACPPEIAPDPTVTYPKKKVGRCRT